MLTREPGCAPEMRSDDPAPDFRKGHPREPPLISTPLPAPPSTPSFAAIRSAAGCLPVTERMRVAGVAESSSCLGTAAGLEEVASRCGSVLPQWHAVPGVGRGAGRRGDSRAPPRVSAERAIVDRCFTAPARGRLPGHRTGPARLRPGRPAPVAALKRSGLSDHLWRGCTSTGSTTTPVPLPARCGGIAPCPLDISTGRRTGAITVPTTYVWSTGDVAVGRRAAELTGRWVTGPFDFKVLEGVSRNYRASAQCALGRNGIRPRAVRPRATYPAQSRPDRHRHGDDWVGERDLDSRS
jgi:hypothetical protein